MLRDTESKFLDGLDISRRGIVKTASSQLPGDKERVQRMLKSFERSPDVSKDVLGKFQQRAELDLDSKSVEQDFFVELKAMRQKESLHLATAMTLRKAGLFKVAGRDVYEDLETGDFWKISEDKKHVLRLFKEDDIGVADKKASTDKNTMQLNRLGKEVRRKFEIATFTVKGNKLVIQLTKESKDKGKISKFLLEERSVSPTQFEVLEYTTASKEAGRIKGPGIPDGTGPMKDSPQCPYNKNKEEKQDADLTDDQIEKLFDYIDANNICHKTIGLVPARNDPKKFDKNVEKLVAYLKKHKLLDKALKFKGSREAGKEKGPGEPDGTGPMRRRLRHRRRQPFADDAENEKGNEASTTGKKVEAKKFEGSAKFTEAFNDVYSEMKKATGV